MKNFNNYADYVSHIENEINTVINELYLFKKTELNNGMNECKLLANLTFNLGSVNYTLRGILNNQIPTQYELLDKLFNEINIHKLEPLFCIALLRYTFTSRYGMKEWLRVRNEIKHKLEKENLEVKKLMKGLL